MRHYMIGPLPPPIGGISVYIDRASRKLRAEGRTVVNVRMQQIGKARRILALTRILLDPRPAVFEVHTYDFVLKAILLLRPWCKRIIYFDHNTRLYAHDLSRLRRAILRRFLRRADELYFVSESAMQYYGESGFLLSPSAEVRNAYLPPPQEDAARIIAGYSDDTREFLGTRKPLLVANASRLIKLRGVDLYGVDMCVELVARLVRQFPNVGLVFALADADSNSDYLIQLKHRIDELGIGRNVHFLTGQQELWPVFRDADLMVRPTLEDGYSVSIEEAIACGCRTLASDAAVRPAATRIFRNRDVDDMYAAAVALLQEMSA